MMPQDTSELAELAKLIDTTPLPESGQGVELLAVSHDEFQARWSLTEDVVRKGRKMASPMQNETHLVLRAFSLPPDSNGAAVSSVWHDFNIEGTDNSGYFTLPGPTSAINAAIGLVNKDGRFSPLLRGESIDLPAAPAPAPKVAPKAEEKEAAESTPLQRQPDFKSLDEASITERLSKIEGLPESFKAPAEDALAVPEGLGYEPLFSEPKPESSIKHPEHSGILDEAGVLGKVRGKLAADPEPEIEEPVETPADPEVVAGASEQLASQWEDIWSANAPIEVRAQYVLSGKIKSGMKLLLGNQIIEPTAGGYFVWKRGLDSFDQVWPILQAALQTPSVAAGPSLQFFHEVDPSQRLLEIHGALEIEGRVTEADYIDRLPSGLRVGENGEFKLTRMLPDGAVILPGLSLIAG